MELSALKIEFHKLIGDGDFISCIRNALFSDAKNAVQSGYVDLVNGDLETDELQKIFQYDYADRKEKMQDYTPRSIAKLCAALTETGGGVVYDLCAGSGALTIQKWAANPDKTFFCEELDERVIPLLLFNLTVRNISGYVIHRNALSMETKAVYKLSSGERFSEISVVDGVPRITADEIISNPPYNMKWEPPAPLMADGRFQCKPIPAASNANYAFVLTALSRLRSGGKCAFVLPSGALSSDSEKESREYLTESGLIERVISLPERMFESTSIPTCVVSFSAGNSVVKMYDCRQKAEREQRDQNGQYGGASHQRRTYHKTVNILPDNLIESICASIKENDYNLVPARYIEAERQERSHRAYADIMTDINRVSRERSVIKLTVNEKLAKSLGIYDIAQVKSESGSDDLDRTFQFLGGHYENRRYITLTKNKNEFKFENQDKELFSSLISFFLPMWKQHIFYLNQEENRLLAELRDAMLPELMSGKLSVD